MTNREDSFDRVSRSFARAKSRRDVMRILGGGFAAAVGGMLLPRAARGTTHAECAHSKCVPGKALSHLCDDECVQEICLWDDYCCNQALGEWDATCVGYVQSRCGHTCPPPTPDLDSVGDSVAFEGQTVAGVVFCPASVPRCANHAFYVAVPVGGARLVVTLIGTGGDYDLRLRQPGGQETISGHRESNQEISIPLTQAGWYVAAASPFTVINGTYTITATLAAP